MACSSLGSLSSVNESLAVLSPRGGTIRTTRSHTLFSPSVAEKCSQTSASTPSDSVDSIMHRKYFLKIASVMNMYRLIFLS
jgi:hypothetical protein